MLALVFDPGSWRLPLAGAASRIDPRWALRGPSLLSLRQLEEPRPPRPEWVRLRVLRTGVCGSDVKEVLLQASSDNPLSGLVSLPHVPGHEIVAEVVDPGFASPLAHGTVVAVDPWLGCRARGLEPSCPSCLAGFPPHCRAVTDGGPWGTGRGMHLGTVRGLPGGFAEVIYAHPSQLHPLAAGLDFRLAVLADPIAVGLHALERAGPEPQGPVLVLGAGTIGLGLALAALHRWPGAEVYVTATWEHQRSLIRELGASPLAAASAAVVEEMAVASRGRLARPWRGGAFVVGGGAQLVLDSIGSAATMELGLKALAPGGRFVTVGVGRPQRVENTLAYYKEARIMGSNGYGVSELMAGEPHLLDVALDLLAARQGSMARWLTHSFSLSQWRRAFTAAARPDRSGAIKVSLEP